MFKRFFLQLMRSERRGDLRRNGWFAIGAAWLVLNGCLWLIPGERSPWLVVALNGWFFLLLVLAYDYGRKWLSLLLKDVRSTEQWARCYFKDNIGGQQESAKKVPFHQGNWVVTDAILAMNRQIEQAVTQSYQVDQFVRAQTFLDSETGIGNRIYFDHRIEAFLTDKENDSSGYVFLIQLKELDIIEAESGEDEAKELLSYFIALISHHLENYTNVVFARRSELDFAILIPNINSRECENIGSKLIRLCHRITLPDCVDSEHFFHIGVGSCKANENAYQLMAEADMALRAAQLQGPSNWFMYDRAIVKDLTKGSVKWRTALEAAIAHQAFVMLFQPAILTDNSEIHHHEILARMRTDNGHLASAAVFLPMAQKCGLVVKIDQLVVEKTIKLLQYENSVQDICSLNLHIDSLHNEDFQQWLLDYFQRYPNVACRIIIEVSEYQLVHQEQSLRSFFRQLHKTGARLLVDQVGLYVLNTQYVREYEIDYLKLHVSIVKNIDLRPENQLFVKSLQGACRGTHVLIFGLGVERVGEWIALQKLGITGAQGHYFTEPLASINQITPSH